jgi:hypothetical protein
MQMMANGGNFKLPVYLKKYGYVLPDSKLGFEEKLKHKYESEAAALFREVNISKVLKDDVKPKEEELKFSMGGVGSFVGSMIA